MDSYINDEDNSQENKQPTIVIKNTNFVNKTNFSGDPKRDNYGSDKRHANLIIPDAALAQDLLMDGFNVKTYYVKNKDGSNSGTPIFFIDIKINYGYKVPPEIYLVSATDNKMTLLNEDTVGSLDYISVQSVDADLTIVENKKQPGKKTLYVRYLYVVQMPDNPFADKYAGYQVDRNFSGSSEKQKQDGSNAKGNDESQGGSTFYRDPGDYGNTPFD